MDRTRTHKDLLILTGILVFLFIFTNSAFSATFYVREDGGTSGQCTGLVDAAYGGVGENQPCAFKHPFSVFGVHKGPSGPFQGGDTLIIKNGSYKIGYGAGFSSGNCDHTNYTYSCFMQSVPSGPDPMNPSRILGEEWDSGCAAKPELWATERAERVINLIGSSNVEVQCLDITDHASCGYYGGDYGGTSPCNRNSYPHGDYGEYGIRAQDNSNVLLKNLDIHGFSEGGILAGRIADWTLENVNIVGNAFVGWNGDIYNDDFNSGTLTFNNVTIMYNGCIESYPDKSIFNCISQGQGGYGDGLATGFTGGNWVFNEVDFSYNTSDGMDLLYHNGNGFITVKRSRFEGNAGNALKTAAQNVTIENSLMIGNCDYFVNNPITWSGPGFHHCRAAGNTVAFTMKQGHTVSLLNSTLTGRGDVIVESNGNNSCDGSEYINVKNSIFQGNTKWTNGEPVTYYYASGSDGNGSGPCGSSLTVNTSHSVVHNVKNGCPVGEEVICKDPQFTGPLSGDNWGVSLKSSSPAIGKAKVLTGKSDLDFKKKKRGDVWDIGAIEYAVAEEEPTCVDNIDNCTTEADCVAQGYYWYNDVCNANPEPLPSCADDILYCSSESECSAQGFHWYNNACHYEPQALPTCADDILYCANSTDCAEAGYFWYNNGCNASPEPEECVPTWCDAPLIYCNETPITGTDSCGNVCTKPSAEWPNCIEPEPTCADGIQYCTNSAECISNGYYWYSNACYTVPEPEPTCAEGIQYCTTEADCTGQGYYWYNNLCNYDPEPLPTCADGPQYCPTSIECEVQGYHWYNSICNLEPEPLPTCADGPEYCITSAECESNKYYWYDNTCNAGPKPEPTCADGVEYCLTSADCIIGGYFWYDAACHTQPEPTCADDILYCAAQADCEGQGYYWYNNTCNSIPEPLPTCADGPQYCTKRVDCTKQGYYWYDKTCHADPEPVTQSTKGKSSKTTDSTTSDTTSGGNTGSGGKAIGKIGGISPGQAKKTSTDTSTDTTTTTATYDGTDTTQDTSTDTTTTTTSTSTTDTSTTTTSSSGTEGTSTTTLTISDPTLTDESLTYESIEETITTETEDATTTDTGTSTDTTQDATQTDTTTETTTTDDGQDQGVLKTLQEGIKAAWDNVINWFKEMGK